MKRKVLRRGLLGLGILAIGLWAVVTIWLAPPGQNSEILFHGGPIVTMADTGTVDSLLVRDGKIIAVGDEASVRAKASKDAVDFDLKSKTLLPGLIDPHSHPVASATLGAAIDVSGFSHNSRAEVMQTLKDALDGWQLGDWAVAFGWDPVMIDDLEPPTLAELDALSPDRPLVIMTQMMHDVYANSAALKAAGITDTSPNPAVGEFGRDADGHLNGMVRELGAIEIIFSAMPPPPEGSADLLLNLQLGAYARAGYTTITAMGAVGRVDDPIGLIRRHTNAPDSPMRAMIYATPNLIAATTVPDQPLSATPLVGVKFWMDGSPYTGGAALAEPYTDSALVRDRLHLPPGHSGAVNMSAEAFESAFSLYHQRGFQVAVHVQGERAIDRVLDAAEHVLLAHPRADHRHRLEHDALITKAQLERARALGLTTSFFIDHIYFYGHRLPELVGPDRTTRYMPLRAALDAGHHVSLHGDYPATPIGPIRSFASAVSRKTRRDGVVIADGQQLSRMDALKALTISPAWQLGIDAERGSLEPGKAADLVILSDNPLTAAEDDLRDIKALDTWIAGRKVDHRVTTRANARLLWQVILNSF